MNNATPANCGVSVISILKTTALIAGSLIILFVVLSIIMFGTWTATVAWANGSKVLVEPDVAKIDIRSNTTIVIPFTLRRLSSCPIRVVGATSSCSCIRITGLPLEIRERTAKIEASFTAENTTVRKEVEQTITLYLNVDSAETVLAVRANIIP